MSSIHDLNFHKQNYKLQWRKRHNFNETRKVMASQRDYRLVQYSYEFIELHFVKHGPVAHLICSEIV